MKNWRKIVFWLSLAAFLACMAWTILSGLGSKRKISEDDVKAQWATNTNDAMQWHSTNGQ
jgi:hypothetical protein